MNDDIKYDLIDGFYFEDDNERIYTGIIIDIDALNEEKAKELCYGLELEVELGRNIRDDLIMYVTNNLKNKFEINKEKLYVTYYTALRLLSQNN